MSQQHPITPPPELVEEWRTACIGRGHAFIDVATKAVQWGADQELEACYEWFQEFYETESWVKRDLKEFRAARRPKPPSLKEQAMEALEHILYNSSTDLGAEIIRRALEALDD